MIGELESSHAAGARQRWLGLDWFELALLALFVSVVAPFVPGLHAQEASRYAFTAAVTEQGRFEVDDYEELLSADRVDLDGHVYSDKAPGQPLLGVPVLAVAEWLGAEPGTEIRHFGNLGAWSQSLAFCVIPGAGLLILMRRHASRTERGPDAAVAALALSFGTLLLPMSSALYAHVFVATLTFASWHVLSRERRPSSLAVLVAGALTALAVVSEYPMAGVALVLGGHVAIRFGWRKALLFALPQCVAAAGVVAMNQIVYGFIGTSYEAKEEGSAPLSLIPDPGHLFRIFLGEKGYAFTPIVIVGVVGLVVCLRRSQWDVVVPACIFGGFLVLQSGWSNPWGGEPPGSRYILPALPFLVLPVARMLPHIPVRARRGLIALGVVSMTLPLITMPLVRDDETLIVGHLLNIDRFGFTPTIFTMAIGPAGWVLHGALVLAAAFAVRANWPGVSPPRPLPA